MQQSQYDRKNKFLKSKTFVLILFSILTVIWGLYVLFGKQLIIGMYNGTCSIEILNRVIEGQNVHSVEYYFEKTNRLFYRFPALFFIYFLVFSLFKYRKRIKNTLEKKKLSMNVILTVSSIVLCSCIILHILFHADVLMPMVLFLFFISMWLFFIYNNNKEAESKTALVSAVALIILNGTIIRLFLAYTCCGNCDMYSFETFANIFIKGGNVYTDTNIRYPYSPIWFILLGFLKRIQIAFPVFTFHFVQRTFMCGIDLLTLLFLILISKTKKISIINTTLLFYLNPVSFLLTGYHGQFENLAVLMILIGIFGYFKLENNPVLRGSILWVFSTLGMVVKHNVFYELIVCVKFVTKTYKLRFFLLVVSGLIFLSLLIPYLDDGSKRVVKSVFLFSSIKESYGINTFFYFKELKYLFVLGLFIYPFFLKNKDIIKQCLLCALFFLVFTTGIGIQYFILPVAFGALYPSKGFLLYSLTTSLFILGSVNNVNLGIFKIFSWWDIVWISAIYWFIAEQLKKDSHHAKIFGYL